MKMMILIVIATLAPVLSNACSAEIQVIGKAKNVQGCRFEIEYTMYSPSLVYALNEDQAEDSFAKSITGDCSVKEGDDVSGVLMWPNGEMLLDQ
jgi:hypothetical protein